MKLLINPRTVVNQVALALPESCRGDVIIIGSLAAGYHFFRENTDDGLRTKDVDCMIAPHAKSIVAAQKVTEQLIDSGWGFRDGQEWSKPGTSDQPVEQLPLVRLRPPGQTEWFLELLVAPAELPDEEAEIPGRRLERFETKKGSFALCSFGFLAVTEVDPVVSDHGVRVARAEMMALANLLHHPVIGPATMSGHFAQRKIKRSNKDLGRVLGLAFLAERAQEDSTTTWAQAWQAALAAKFPRQAARLLARSCDGIKALLDSPQALEEALLTLNLGLLYKFNLDDRALAAIGQRFMEDVARPARTLAKSMQ
ncbi:hypothetical protein [Variovorax sp. UMC13]|uniref:hypothetical protein n=1 Tax=Variovorax sp. UMC13 TaxID=1862326 RepID=UPI001600229C|nr:hypothetical protein [Variovorax sp. UMC13]